MGLIAKLFGGSNKQRLNKNTYRGIINGEIPVFSSFGRDIMLSDIVKTAVHRIAEEVSKCSLQSVVVKTKPLRKIEVADDELNGIFGGWVNPLMTLKDFLYKIAFLTVKNTNCFIYPQFEEIAIGGGLVRRKYKAFYPLDPSLVTIYHNGAEWRIELTQNDVTFEMPYSDIIHIRHKYGANPFLGGDRSGRLDARGLLGNLQIMQTVKECIPKTLEASLSLKGILTMKTVAEVDKKVLAVGEFEKHLFDSKYGIVATDYESDFTPLNITPTDLPKGIMEFLQNEILMPFGVSFPIICGKWTDDEFSAFYSAAIEGILLSIAQTFTAVLFTPRERAFGNRIKVYDRLVQNLSIDKRIKIVELASPPALLWRDEQRELLGFEPDGEPTQKSLNFVNTAIADIYQLEELQKKAKQGGANNE